MKTKKFLIMCGVGCLVCFIGARLIHRTFPNGEKLKLSVEILPKNISSNDWPEGWKTSRFNEMGIPISATGTPLPMSLLGLSDKEIYEPLRIDEQGYLLFECIRDAKGKYKCPPSTCPHWACTFTLSDKDSDRNRMIADCHCWEKGK